jgi:hypothetical protein
VLSFVASGHVVIMDAAARKPLICFETTVARDLDDACIAFVIGITAIR